MTSPKIILHGSTTNRGLASRAGASPAPTIRRLHCLRPPICARAILHKRGFLLPWFVWGLLVLLLLTACSAGQGLSSPSPMVRSQPTQQTAPGLSPVVQRPTQQTSPGPSQVATLLAPAPQDCPSAPSLGSKVLPQFSSAPLTGSGAVWELGLPVNATLHLNEFGYTPWPSTKILWPIGPDFPNTVVVRVTNLGTGSEAWWDIGAGGPPPTEPVRPLVLDRTGNRAGFPTWGTGLYFPQAGCYAMSVSWPGGQWRLLFAVGR